ncbi:helix-turn-helix domain-containing protein [Labilibacter marinus]|uniref:helix-turn-helix domain-containing protein n=1 Tax=Labilibacter marinus TaxID=1477105 RepID=UPI000834A85E|nr:AraC family transcriptional regulator [Labilibacter marinus]
MNEAKTIKIKYTSINKSINSLTSIFSNLTVKKHELSGSYGNSFVKVNFFNQIEGLQMNIIRAKFNVDVLLEDDDIKEKPLTIVRFCNKELVEDTFNKYYKFTDEKVSNISLFNRHTPLNLLIPKGEEIYLIGFQVNTNVLTQFSEDTWPELPELINFNLAWKHQLYGDLSIEEYFNDIFRLQETRIGKNGLMLSKALALLTHFFIQLSLQEEKSKMFDVIEENLKVMHKIKDALLERINNPPDIKSLALEFGISESGIHHNFKTIFGVPPIKFLQNSRLENARNLLIDTSTPITNIALDLGYNDSAHFSRSFRNKFGMSPSSYRNGRLL